MTKSQVVVESERLNKQLIRVKSTTNKPIKKKKRISKIARGRLAKAMVFLGRKVKTSGGLYQMDLERNKRGKIVSKKASARGREMFTNIEDWVKSIMEIRKRLHVTGFLEINGKTEQGKALFQQASVLYTNAKAKSSGRAPVEQDDDTRSVKSDKSTRSVARSERSVARSERSVALSERSIATAASKRSFKDLD